MQRSRLSCEAAAGASLWLLLINVVKIITIIIMVVYPIAESEHWMTFDRDNCQYGSGGGRKLDGRRTGALFEGVELFLILEKILEMHVFRQLFP